MYQEFIQEENAVFEELQRKLGIEYPVNEILNAQNNSKLANYTSLHKDVKERNKNIKKQNEELRNKFESFEHKQEVSKRKVKEFQEKCDEHLARYEAMYQDLV